ncbi:hypothetical protein [Streptomyces olivoreticuli]|uniref:hypothetical protein n=1 Tax=Streptomyces olivoreticuli TaxID=68246 RepID=UPI000E223BA4|nr:hypothetical protein [Streptomyces olivoreticuli]
MTGNGDNVHGDKVFGDKFTVEGHHNTGKIQNQYHDRQDALISAVQALRVRVSAENRHVLDESLDIVRAGDNTDPGTLHQALWSISAIARRVGEIGVPVARAVHEVMSLLNM